MVLQAALPPPLFSLSQLWCENRDLGGSSTADDVQMRGWRRNWGTVCTSQICIWNHGLFKTQINSKQSLGELAELEGPRTV